MPNRQQKPIFPFPLPLYGLNDKYSPYEIHDLEAATLENIRIGDNTMESRLGYSLHGTTSGSGPIYNAIDYRKSDGTVFEVRQRGTTIEFLSSGTWTTITLPITLTAGLKMCFVVLNDLLLMSNGTDSDLTWNGSGSAVERASNPKAEFQIMIDNRVVKLKKSNSRLYYSDINDPLTYGALNFIAIDPNNASMGKGIGDNNGQITVFKENKKYSVTALVGGSVIPLDGDVSTVSHYSIVSTGQGLIFLSSTGWYRIVGSITYPISGHLDITKLDLANLGNAHAIFHNDRYRCFVTEVGSSYNNLEYVFYTALRTPFPDHPFPVTLNRGLNGLCYYKTIRNDQETLYAGESRSSSGSPATNYSQVYKMLDGTSDNTAAIDAFWTSKLRADNVPYFAKKYKRMYTRVVNQTGLTYYMAYRFSDTSGWSERALVIASSVLSWVMDSGPDITDWLEGQDWPFEGSEDVYSSLSNTGRPKTIQVRNRISSATAQGQWVAQAYQTRIRNKFKK